MVDLIQFGSQAGITFLLEILLTLLQKKNQLNVIFLEFKKYKIRS